MADQKETKRGDNVAVDMKLEVKAEQKSAAPDAAPTTHDLIEKLSGNLLKYAQGINADVCSKLGLEALLKLSAGQKITVLRQTLLPRINAIEQWLEDMARQHQFDLQRDHKQQIARYLTAMCEVAEI